MAGFHVKGAVKGQIKDGEVNAGLGGVEAHGDLVGHGEVALTTPFGGEFKTSAEMANKIGFEAKLPSVYATLPSITPSLKAKLPSFFGGNDSGSDKPIAPAEEK